MKQMKVSPILIGLFASIFLTTIYLYSLILNISKPLSFKYDDAHQVNFLLKHNMDTLLSGNLQDLPTLPMFYGIKNSLFLSNHFLLHSAIALPFYAMTRNPVLTYNLLVVLTIFLSFFFMYLFAHYLTKNIPASVLAAVVFTMNPFVSAHFPDALEIISLEWIPLIFLFFERSLASKRKKDIFFFFLFLAIQILSTLYYAAFLTVILPLYIIIRLKQEKISPTKLFNAGTIAGVLLLTLLAGTLGLFYSQSYSQEPRQRSLEEVILFYSPFLSNWLFTPPSNLLYGNLGRKAYKFAPAFFSVGFNEGMSFFWGIIPLVLFFKSFRLLKSSPKRKLWLASLILLIVSFLLTFGPRIQITSYASLPGPYSLIYLIDPLFHFLRVSARLAVFVFFFLSIIVALTFSEISQKLKPKKALLLSLLLLILVMVEYINRPLQFQDIPQETKQFYNELKMNNDINVIVDLPIGNRLPPPYFRSELYDSHYLFWQMVHGKKLLNGYSSYLPAEHAKKSALLAVDFPTREKLELLKSWGVDAIVLHKDEFNEPKDYNRIKNDLISLKVPEVNSTINLALFDLKNW